MASISFGVGLKFPWVVIACVKANLSSPPAKVVDGICKMVPLSCIVSLTAKNNLSLIHILRAHETKANLVCRLLLDKKK